jgi:hypothetical protein
VNFTISEAISVSVITDFRRTEVLYRPAPGLRRVAVPAGALRAELGPYSRIQSSSLGTLTARRIRRSQWLSPARSPRPAPDAAIGPTDIAPDWQLRPVGGAINFGSRRCSELLRRWWLERQRRGTASAVGFSDLSERECDSAEDGAYTCPVNSFQDQHDHDNQDENERRGSALRQRPIVEVQHDESFRSVAWLGLIP